jgi:hypothetical protein
MAAERPKLIERPFIKGGLIFVGALVVVGVSIQTINYALAAI